jgi:hypothetical protein
MSDHTERDPRHTRGAASPGSAGSGAASSAPGKRTLTEGLPAGTATPAPGGAAAAISKLPPERPFHIGTGGMSALVRRDWLREHSYQRYSELVSAMHRAGAFPWASAERLARLAASYAPPTPTAPDLIEIAFGVQALAIVGLPPSLPHQINRVGDDLFIILTIVGTAIAPTTSTVGHGNTPVMTEVRFPRQVASARADHVIDLEPIDSAAIYRALAAYTGLAVVAPLELSAVVENPTTILLRLHDRELAAIFGADAWQRWKAPSHARKAAKDRATGPTRTPHPAGHAPPPAPAPPPTSTHGTSAPKTPAAPTHAAPGSDAPPSELTAAERARVAAWIHDVGGGPATSLPRELVAMIDEAEADPDLARAVKASLTGQPGPARAIDVIALRRAIDRAKLERDRARLGLGVATLAAPATDADPIGIEIPAKLVQRGLLLSGREAHFDLVLDWNALGGFNSSQREALAKRPWHAVVEWVFERSDTQGAAIAPGAPIVKPDTARTEHTGNAIGIARTFRLDPAEPRGVWTVHAFLHTSHFAPRQITTTVEVKTETARMADLRGEAFTGLAPDRTTTEPHTFGIGILHQLANAGRLLPRRGDADADGTVGRGALPSGFTARTAAQRADNRAAEIAQTEQLIAYLTAQRRADNADAIDAAARRLAQLRKADNDVRGDEAHGWQSFELRGTYLSRQAEVPSGALDLYGTVKRERQLGPVMLDHVEVQIRDQSQRLGAEDFQFTGRGPTFQVALEDAFVALCKQYPEGKLAVMAQEMSPGPVGGTGQARGTGQAISFELATTSPWKRLKSKIYNPAVQAVVNVAATALMVFQPELAPLLLPLVTVSATVNNLDELITQHANRTLTMSSAGITLAQIGLDFLPYVRGARLLTSEARLFAFEIASHVGMVAVIGLRAREEIARIQEGDIAALAEQYRALLELEKTTNPSDATLAQKRADIAAGAQHVRDATAKAWTQAIGENGIFLVGRHITTTIQRTRLQVGDEFSPGVRATGVGDQLPGAAIPTSSAAGGSPIPSIGARVDASGVLTARCDPHLSGSDTDAAPDVRAAASVPPAGAARTASSGHTPGEPSDQAPVGPADPVPVTSSGRVPLADPHSPSLSAVERGGLIALGAAPHEIQTMGRAVGMDPERARRLLETYGHELVEQLRTQPLTTLADLEAALAKRRQHVRSRVDGLYESTDKPPDGWKLTDVGPTREADGTLTITTNVQGPNGAEGQFVRSYNPATKTLELRYAFLKKSGRDLALPGMVPKQGTAPEMIDAKGTPTVQYITLYQMRKLGVPLGAPGQPSGVRMIHMSDIQNVETIVHLHYLRTTTGQGYSDLVRHTASVKYAETTATQTGYHRSDEPVITGGGTTPIRDLLEFQEGSHAQRAAENDQILARYGFNRDTPMRWGFDIDFQVAPDP